VRLSVFCAGIVVALVAAAACERVGPGLSPGSNAVVKLSSPAAKNYAKLCATCHGANREGGPDKNRDYTPSLASPTFLATVSDDFLRSAINDGRPGTAMGGFGHGKPLSDADVAEMLAFIRTGSPQRAVLHALPPGQVGAGKDIYAHNCQTCHGMPGQRGTAVYLASPKFLGTASDEFIAYAIENGRPGTQMPPWSSQLSPQQIADTVSYVRSFSSVASPPVEPGNREVPKDLPIVINPSGPAPVFPTLKEDRYVPAADVKAQLDKGARMVIADARPPADWIHVHIPGSISLPYFDLDQIDRLPTDGTWVLTYCACPHHVSGILLDELRKRGFKNSAVIDEGILGWQRAGYPAVDVDGHPVAMPPAPPQPQLSPQPTHP
jgi:cytochrome c oxidase cbb3-type subunit 3/ubiquinol-cytochrome c reductase cytochrome c subunit